MQNNFLPGDIIYTQGSGNGVPGVRQPLQPGLGSPAFTPGNTRLSAHSDDWENIKPSPDGLKIALTLSSTALLRTQILDVPTGTLEAVAIPTPGDPVTEALAWRPDSTEFTVCHATAPFVSRYSRSGAKLTDVAPSPGVAVNLATYSPDGRYLALNYASSATRTDNGIFVYNLLTGATRVELLQIPVSEGTGGALSVTCATGLCFSPDGTKLWAISYYSSSTARYFGYFDTSNWQWHSLPFARLGLSSSDSRRLMEISSDGNTMFITGDTSGTNRFNFLDISNPEAPKVLTKDTWPYGTSTNGTDRVAYWMGSDLLILYIATTSASATFYPPNKVGAGPIMFRVNPDKTVSMIGVPYNLGFFFSGTTIGIMPGGALRRFAGVVKDKDTGAPLERMVRAINRRTGRTIAEAKSGVSGAFELLVTNTEPAIVYCVGEGSEVVQLEDAVIPASP